MAKPSRTWGEQAKRVQAGRDNLLPIWDGRTGLLLVMHDGQMKMYLLTTTARAADGLTLAVLPLGEKEPYGVRVSHEPKGCSCECKGYLTGGYCRHLIALGELFQAGMLGAKDAGGEEVQS